MIRGATPPSDEEWLRDLPGYQEGFTGFCIFEGTSYEFTNPVVYIGGSRANLVEMTGTSEPWYFETDEGFKYKQRVESPQAILETILQSAGITGISAGNPLKRGSFDRKTIRFKIEPTV